MKAHHQRLMLATLMLALFAVWAVAAIAQPLPAQPLPAITITPVYGDEDAIPVVMLTVLDPWRAVIGSDSPVFVAYETGQVIYSRVNADDEVEYWSVMLDEDTLAELVAQVDVEAIAALDDFYDIAQMTDQPSQSFTVASGAGGLKQVVVYGSLLSDADVRSEAPEALVDAYDLLTGYAHPDAERWLPTHFEVMLWPWDTSDAVDWPGDFPQLDSPFAVARQDVTSLYVEASEYERFVALARGEDALRLDGGTYAFSVRWPFPHEVVWPMRSPAVLTAEATDAAQ